jgi:hypothetical protein
VSTDLTVTVDGAAVEVRSTGDRLFVEVPSLSTARTLLQSGPDDVGPLSTVLSVTDLTTEVRVREATVAVVGTDARPGVLSAELGVAPAEFRLGGALAAAGREALATLGSVRQYLPG